jgi:polysaccharide export outer membrane protein
MQKPPNSKFKDSCETVVSDDLLVGSGELSVMSREWSVGSGSKFKVKGSMFKAAVLYGLIMLLFFSSCTTTKNTNYFQGIKNDTTITNLVSKDFEPRIQKGDLLSITVASLSPDNTVIYNAPQNIQGTATGYLVDGNGNINFFKLDTLHVEGMTRKELKETLEKDLTPYLAQTVVAVGFLNRHITMIGALSSIIPMPNDNMTILDAISTAGGIGDNGKKDDILVIREKDGNKEFKKLDLTDESIFHSPYFYLQPNDIIYVKPVKKKTDNTARIISYVTAGISFVFLIIDRILK